MNIYITSSAMEASVSFAAALNEVPRPFWIVAVVLAFAWHWPIGLLVLGFLLGRSHWRRRAWGPGCWYNTAQAQTGGRAGAWGAGMFDWGSRGPGAPPASGNNAFDEYRAETLRRLEEEQKEFQEYLERLRRARDKAEFDQFMADRRTRPEPEAGV
jgi:hypothetical protein